MNNYGVAMTGVAEMDKIEERESIILENDGQKIFGVLHRPKGKTNVPAVLICHGLAGHKTGQYRVYVDLAQRLSQQGIATFRFDYRGCGDSEGDFYDVTPESHYSDALLSLKFLRSLPEINASRIGIFGRSFGGPVAVVTAARAKEGVKSLVLWCPMFSGDQWQDQWQLVQTNAVDESLKLKMMQVNSQQGSYQFFDAFFSLNIANDLKQLSHIPLLHIHGENDSRINIQHAIEYEKCRVNASGKSEFIRLANTDHDFSHLNERMSALEITEKWFVDTL